MNQKTQNFLKSAFSRLINREITFSSRGKKIIALDNLQAADLLPVRYTYRSSSDGWVSYTFLLSGDSFRYTLYTMAFDNLRPVLGDVCFSFSVDAVHRGDNLRINLITSEVQLNGKKIDTNLSGKFSSRKYIAYFQVHCDLQILSRFFSHYLPYEAKIIGEDYYFGDDYTEYPLHVDTKYALDWVGMYCNGGKLLDVGCALGIYTKAFFDSGYDAYGIDISEYAVNEARNIIGGDRIKQCNLDESEIPYDTAFEILWMSDVLEHSAKPQLMLSRMSKKASQGAYLFLSTSNADSLTHFIFGADWEGYSDYSHYGVNQISVKSLRNWLENLGWDILDLKCSQIWVFGNDPVNLRLREAFKKIPELQLLLNERDLGDVIQVVARKK